MDKIKIRFGIKTNNWFFPNAAVFVFSVPKENFAPIELAVNNLRSWLPGKWGGQIVFERRE